MSELWSLSQTLQTSGLAPVAVDQLLQFIALASRLKDAILFVQPGNFAIGSARPILSPAIQEFLAEACLIPLRSVNIVWKFLTQTVWTMGPVVLPTNGLNLPSLYAKFGHSRGISEYLALISVITTLTYCCCNIAYRMLFPPDHHCKSTSCKRYQRLMLKKSESNQAIFFTMDHGAIPIFSVHLSCEGL